METNQTGQTSLEYLLILIVALVAVAVVFMFLMGFFDSASQQGDDLLSGCRVGEITMSCSCGGVEYSSGYCCESEGAKYWSDHECVELGQCSEGVITAECMCGGVSWPLGYCCGGVYSSTPCISSDCGNGEIDEGEVCDGADFLNKTCTDFDSLSYTTIEGLQCLNNCRFIDYSACPFCGDGVCNVGFEDPVSCGADCSVNGSNQTVCGNGVCESGEDALSCIIDCGGGNITNQTVCGNGVCEAGEALSCPQDCVPKECQENQFCGTVKSGSAGLGNVSLSYFNEDFSGLLGSTRSDASGWFAINTTPSPGGLIVEPERVSTELGDLGVMGVMGHAPRNYIVVDEESAEIELPEAGTFVILAYDTSGQIIRWADFLEQGNLFSSFIYATDTNDESVEAAVWPLYDDYALGSNAWDNGVPSIMIEPGQRVVIQPMYWVVPGYGKLLLRADNQGSGFDAPDAGQAQVIELNLELARTAVHDVRRRFGSEASSLESQLRSAEGRGSARERASAADSVLRNALELRDSLEVEEAEEQIDSSRKGDLTVRVEDSRCAAGCTISIEQQSHEFLFGVMEGPSANRLTALQTAFDAGFNMHVFLPAWGFIEDGGIRGNPALIDYGFQFSTIEDMGYKMKVHGTTWLQTSSGIMPQKVEGMSWSQIKDEGLEFQEEMLDAFADRMVIWEAMNEPANSNDVGMPRDAVISMLGEAAANIKETSAQSLVNAPHESFFQMKYSAYTLDNELVHEFPMTYSAFLSDAGRALSDIDIIGLQFYPGYKINPAQFGYTADGPAMTPSWLYDTIQRYKRFGKDVHITEISMPSSYESDWTAGYWRNKWNENTQADYAEMAYTIAFSDPDVKSITWWDLTDSGPAMITGGLLRSNGVSPKPVFTRLAGLIEDWTTIDSASGPEASFRGFGGEYKVLVEFDSGSLEDSCTIREGRSSTCVIG